jgi:N-acetylglucosamine-6-phosphate deacetylase
LRPPDTAVVADWSPATGVRLVTLAPELPGALAVIEALTAQGVVVSAGHSLASHDQAFTAVDRGIRYATHLFNAMTPLHQREPGLAAAALAAEAVVIGLLPDGLHVHPTLVKLVWQLVGPQRLNLVTDAMAALGMPAGVYDLGDYRVHVDGQRARLEDGTLAGSVISLDTAVRNLVTFTGCSLAEAITTVTLTPARLLGLAGQKGRLAAGHDADLVLLTATGHVMATVVGGRVVYREEKS